MMSMTLNGLTEDELDTLVSIAIRRAEVLDDAHSPAADEAWHEVKLYEEQLAAVTRPDEITGGIARVGAVRAALASGNQQEATRLAARYMEEPQFPVERREAIRLAFEERQQRLAERFPALAKRGGLSELQQWRVRVAENQGVFPLMA